MTTTTQETRAIRAERARYLKAIPDALWPRLTYTERRCFLDGTLAEIRALAATLGIAPARTDDKKALERYLNGVHPPAALTEVPAVTPNPQVEDVDPRIARAMGLLPADTGYSNGAVHYPSLDPANVEVSK